MNVCILEMLCFDRIDVCEGMKEFMLIKEVQQKSMIFVTIGIS